MTFAADFAGAIVVEAAQYGYPKGAHNNRPRAIGLHTPEEAPDDYPGTPYYFHNLTDRQASTTYFVSYHGLVFQCVPEDEGAYGNAVEGKPYPPWADPSVNLNLQTDCIEIEGYADSIHLTMPRGSPQWVSLVRLMADICRRRPAVHIEWSFGHYQVSIYRRDPGQLDIAALVADVTALLAGLEDIMPELSGPEQREMYNNNKLIFAALFDKIENPMQPGTQIPRWYAFELVFHALFDDVDPAAPVTPRFALWSTELLKAAADPGALADAKAIVDELAKRPLKIGP